MSGCVLVPDKYRLGPGCSSFDGALLELGPVAVHGRGANATLVENPGRWNEYADVLYIDQPAGTGYRSVESIVPVSRSIVIVLLTIILSYINKGEAVTELGPVGSTHTDHLSLTDHSFGCAFNRNIGCRPDGYLPEQFLYRLSRIFSRRCRLRKRVCHRIY